MSLVRYEIDVVSGERVAVEQTAYNTPDGVQVVDSGTAPPAGWDPLPAGSHVTPPTSELVAQLRNAVQEHMDKAARARGYDSMLSLCTYATSSNPKFKAEAQAGVVWRDECWQFGYDLMDRVLAGNEQAPSAEDLVARLPKAKWPGE